MVRTVYRKVRLYRLPALHGRPLGVHEQFAEDLALHSLGALEGKAKCALELHLDSCAFCQNELRQLQREVALLALSVVGRAHAVKYASGCSNQCGGACWVASHYSASRCAPTVAIRPRPGGSARS